MLKEHFKKISKYFFYSNKSVEIHWIHYPYPSLHWIHYPLPYPTLDSLPLPYPTLDSLPLPYPTLDSLPLPYLTLDSLPLPYPMYIGFTSLILKLSSKSLVHT